MEKYWKGVISGKDSVEVCDTSDKIDKIRAVPAAFTNGLQQIANGDARLLLISMFHALKTTGKTSTLRRDGFTRAPKKAKKWITKCFTPRFINAMKKTPGNMIGDYLLTDFNDAAERLYNQCLRQTVVLSRSSSTSAAVSWQCRCAVGRSCAQFLGV